MSSFDGAVFSDDGVYRYALERVGWMGGDGTCLFVMLNPSTADAHVDDRTIRRCKDFARDWGFARLTVANLYAYRATDPRDLPRGDAAAIGPDNDGWIVTLANEADAIIAAWGAHAGASRARDVLYLLDHGQPVQCLGFTAAGAPLHPLYIPASRQPVVFEAKA